MTTAAIVLLLGVIVTANASSPLVVQVYPNVCHTHGSPEVQSVYRATSTHSAWAKVYAYCGGDPVNRSDPSGLAWQWVQGSWYFITGTGEGPAPDYQGGADGEIAWGDNARDSHLKHALAVGNYSEFTLPIGRGHMAFPMLPPVLQAALGGGGGQATAYTTDPATGKVTFFSSFDEANAYAKARGFEIAQEAWNNSLYKAPSPNGLYFVPWQKLKERSYALGGKHMWDGAGLVGEGAVEMGKMVAPWEKAFRVVKWVDKAGEGAGTALGATESIATGGRTVTKWRWGAGNIPGEIGGKEAQEAYAAIKSSGTDIEAIVRYQGLNARSAERLGRIKEYLFNNPGFHADPQIAAAWNRLRTGAGTEADMVLLKHEAVEMYGRAKHGLSQADAHRRATELFDWASTLDGK